MSGLVPPAVLALQSGSWWQVLLDNALGITILVIFLAAVIIALINAWWRDKCLKLLDDYHVTYLQLDGTPTWGDLTVFSRGIELRFDAPYVTRRGLIKSSALIYEEDLAQCLAICRTSFALSEREQQLRTEQVTRTFNPGRLRRLLRWIRNVINTLRDAILKSIGAIVGQLSKVKPGLAEGRTEVERLGETLLSRVGRAYEPLLEAHIGRPVILRLRRPGAQPSDKPIELPGYLVEYTDRYVAVFNVQHAAQQSADVQVDGGAEQPGLRVARSDDAVHIECTGPEAVVVRHARLGERTYDLDVVLLPGCRLSLTCERSCPASVRVDWTQRLDIVCPRSLARIDFGSDEPVRPQPPESAGREGLAPRQTESEADVSDSSSPADSPDR